MTEFERLEELKNKKIAELKELEGKLAEINKLWEQALITGDDKKKAALQDKREELEKQVQVLKEEMQTIANEQAKHEADYLKAKLSEIEKQRQSLQKKKQAELEVLQGALAKAEKAYKDAKKALNEKQSEWNARLSALDREAKPLLERLEAITEPPGPAHTVEEYLQLFRAGKGPSVIGDDNARKAFKQYKDECEEILFWVRQVQAGSHLPAPKCMQYYTKDRLKEIIYNETLSKSLANLVD